jgi:hypothetical protein
MIALLYFAFVFFFLGIFAGPYTNENPWYWRFNLVSAGLAAYIGFLLWGHGGVK